MIATGMGCMSLDFSIFIEQCKVAIGVLRTLYNDYNSSILVLPVHIITEE